MSYVVTHLLITSSLPMGFRPDSHAQTDNSICYLTIRGQMRVNGQKKASEAACLS